MLSIQPSAKRAARGERAVCQARSSQRFEYASCRMPSALSGSIRGRISISEKGVKGFSAIRRNRVGVVGIDDPEAAPADEELPAGPRARAGRPRRAIPKRSPRVACFDENVTIP